MNICISNKKSFFSYNIVIDMLSLDSVINNYSIWCKKSYHSHGSLIISSYIFYMTAVSVKWHSSATYLLFRQKKGISYLIIQEYFVSSCSILQESKFLVKNFMRKSV